MATEAPPRSNILAIARPIPRVDPVTSATLFWKGCEVFIFPDDREKMIGKMRGPARNRKLKVHKDGRLQHLLAAHGGVFVRSGTVAFHAGYPAAQRGLLPICPGNLSRRRSTSRGRDYRAGRGLRAAAGRKFLRDAESVRLPDRAGFFVRGLALSFREHLGRVIPTRISDDPGGR